MSHPRPVLGRALRVFKSPGRIIADPALAHFGRRYRGKYRFARTVFAIDFVLVAFAAALAVFILGAWLGRPQTPPPLSLAFAATPREAVSLDRVELRFGYQNTTRRPLRDASIAFRLPPGFERERVEPTYYDAKHDQIFLGTLAPGALGEIVIGGLLIAPLDAPARITATVSSEDNRDRWITTPYRFSLPVRGSALNVAIDAPERMNRGDVAPVTVRIAHTGPTQLLDVLITPVPTDGVVTDFEDRPGGAIRTGPLYPGDEKTVTGSVRVISGGTPLLRFRVAVQTPRGLIEQGMVERSIAVADVGVTLKTSIGVGDEPLRPGQEYPVAVTMTHAGAEPFVLTHLAIVTDPPLKEFFLPALADELVPGSSTVVTGTIRLPDDFALRQLEESSHAFSYHAALTGSSDGATLVIREASSSLPVAGNLTLAATARYYSPEGEQLGRGPIPPRAGRATTYWAAIDVVAAPNPARNVTVIATLPGTVRWLGRQTKNRPDAPDAVFDAAARVVRWIIPSLPAGEHAVLSFPLEITPTKIDVGNSPVLVSRVTATAADALIPSHHLTAGPTAAVVDSANTIGS